MLDGEQRAERVASDLVDVKLIYRAALERRGKVWETDQLATDQAAVVVGSDGRPTFVYGSCCYSLLPGRMLEKVGLVGSLVVRGVYDETGRIIERSIIGRGNPAWN